MVERQLKRRGITEPHILDAFRAVPREAFVSAARAHLAYADHPLPIGAGQTISQPYIVALMIQAAAVKAGDKVLEVGSGSGYASAVISRIGARVIGIERRNWSKPRASGWRGSAMRTSRSSKATGRSAGRRKRRTMRSWSLRAAATSRSRSPTSCRPAERW